MILVLIMCAIGGECREERVPLVVNVIPTQCGMEAQAEAAKRGPDEQIQRFQCQRRKS
jgi:hypothetical protein